MCLQQLKRCRCAHLRRYHAQQIIFYREYVHRREFAVLHYYLQRPAERLVFLAFPVKIHAYGNSDKRKRPGGAVGRLKEQFVVQLAVPKHFAFATHCALLATTHRCSHAIVAVEHKFQLWFAHYSHFHLRNVSHICRFFSLFAFYHFCYFIRAVAHLAENLLYLSRPYFREIFFEGYCHRSSHIH